MVLCRLSQKPFWFKREEGGAGRWEGGRKRRGREREGGGSGAERERERERERGERER